LENKGKHKIHLRQKGKKEKKKEKVPMEEDSGNYHSGTQMNGKCPSGCLKGSVGGVCKNGTSTINKKQKTRSQTHREKSSARRVKKKRGGFWPSKNSFWRRANRRERQSRNTRKYAGRGVDRWEQIKARGGKGVGSCGMREHGGERKMKTQTGWKKRRTEDVNQGTSHCEGGSR